MILEFFNYIFFVITFPPSTMNIFSSLRVLSVKFDSIVCQNFLSFSKFSIAKIISEILLRFSEKVNTKISLCFIGKEIAGTIIFPIFINKTSPSHNRFSELFTHEERLVTSSIFSFIGLNYRILQTFEKMYLNFSNSPG